MIILQGAGSKAISITYTIQCMCIIYVMHIMYVLKSMLTPVMKTERKILGSQKIQQQEPLKLALFPGPHSASVLES